MFAFSRTYADPDLWGHIRFGQDLWQTGKIIREDIYSYVTEGQLWINHEWLAEAIFYFVFAAGGVIGLVFFKICFSLLIVGTLYWELRRQVPVALRAAILTVAFSLSLIPYLSSVRPQLFTFFIFLLILILIRKADQGTLRWLWLVPLLLAFGVNLHGGVLASAGIFLLWVVVRLSWDVFRERNLAAILTRSNLVLIGTALAGIAAILLNPYGMQLPLFLLRTATVARPEIAEWQPVYSMNLSGKIYGLVLVIGLAGLIFSRKQRSVVLVILFACTAILPMIAGRHLPLFGLACAVLVADHIADAWDRGMPALHLATTHAEPLSRFSTLCLIMAVALVGTSLPNFQCIRVELIPVKVLALLKQSNAAGNMAVHFDWGEYVLWHLSPQIKVSIDGRRETVYSDRIYRENLRFTSGLGDWDAILKGHPTDLALVSKAYPVFNLMKLTPGWTLAYEDPMSGLFVRQGSPSEGKLRATKPDASDNDARFCFP